MVKSQKDKIPIWGEFIMNIDWSWQDNTKYKQDKHMTRDRENVEYKTKKKNKGVQCLFIKDSFFKMYTLVYNLGDLNTFPGGKSVLEVT